MSVIHCKRWNYLLSKPIDPLTPGEARELHVRGEPYSVASKPEDEELPDRFIEIALRSGHVRVHSLD